MSIDDSKCFFLIGFLLSGFGMFALITYVFMAVKLESDWILTDALWRVFISGAIIMLGGITMIGFGAVLSKIKNVK